MIARYCGTLLLGIVALTGCAGLGSLAQAVQAPQFQVDDERQAQLSLLAPSRERPLGGASVRLWARVSNPNPFGLVLSTLDGALSLEGTQAAEVAFPLGLPLPAAQDTVIPLDVMVSFANLPGLADVLTRAVSRGSVAYRLDGSLGVDAGLLGRPTFGPMLLMQGTLQARR